MKALILALVVVLAGSFANAGEVISKEIKLSECSSQTLVVRLNHKNQSSKKDIVRGMRIVGDYLDLIVTPQFTRTHEVVMEVSPVCERSSLDDCGYESGWDEVQKRLSKVDGVKTQCKAQRVSSPSHPEDQGSPAPPPPPPPPPAPPGGGAQEDAPEAQSRKDSLRPPRRRSEGGVTGSN